MYVLSLQLENVKGFQNLHFEFRRPNGSPAGWNVIVGGNSSGKSTVLKAMALSLAGPDVARQLSSPAGWIYSKKDKAFARLQLEWEPHIDSFKEIGKAPAKEFEIGLRWVSEGAQAAIKEQEYRTPRGGRLQSANRGPWNPNAQGWFSCGYGPMRRLTGSSNEATRHALAGGKEAAFVTLFFEDAALSESEVWLKELQFKALEDPKSDAKQLVGQITSFLNDGLLPNQFLVTRVTSEHVFVRKQMDDELPVTGLELPMRDLSDGCRSVYALLLDIIRHLADTYGAPGLFEQDANGRWVVSKPGVILIDEVESHLHPRWQQNICEWLKQRFPRIQFIVTTHSPLIVQAADPDGIFVLPLPGEERAPRRLVAEEFEKVVLGKAHEVLLGEAFRLDSTRGQWAQERIKLWEELEAKKQSGAKLSGSESKDHKQLERQMELAFPEAPTLQ
jgi:energy-coupling factor transporter ATP-binding protein EcfA2